MPEVVGTLKTPRLATAPAGPVPGQMYFDTTTNELKHWNGTAWVAGGAGGADLVYNGDFGAGGPSYTDGDVVVYNGVVYMCVRPTTSAPTGWSVQSALGYSTTLPSTPVNGQEHVLVDSVTAPTYQWRFRYNANSTSAYKWEYIGGSSLIVAIAGGINITSTTPVQSGGPSITLPRAGVYTAAFGSRVYQQNHAGGQAIPSLFVAGSQFVGIDHYQGSVATSTTLVASHEARECELTVASASAVIDLRYQVGATGGTGTFEHRWLRVFPVRVS